MNDEELLLESIEQTLSEMNINVPDSFDLTDMQSEMDGHVTDALKNVDGGSNLCVTTMPGSNEAVIMFCDRNGWWREATNYDIAQELRRTFGEPFGKTNEAAKEMKAVAAAHKAENNNGEAEKASSKAKYLEALSKEFGAWLGWSRHQRALTARLEVLSCLQVKEMRTDGVRCGDVFVDVKTLDPPRPIKREEHRMLKAGAEIAMDDSTPWEGTGPWYGLLNPHFGAPDSPAFRSFTEVVAWAIFHDESGTKMWVHLQGPSGAGKSVFTKKLLPMLTETAQITNAGLSGKDQFGLSQLAEKPHARVVCGEGEVDSHIDVSVLKNLVSGLGVIVRPFRANPFQVNFIGTFFSDSNEFPSVTLDTGMKRRLLTIPFNTVLEGAPDNELFKKFEDNAPAVMRLLLNAYRNLRNRAIERGCTMIEALDIPDEFRLATEEMAASGARFMQVSDWLSTDHSGDGITVSQSALHRLIQLMDTTSSGSKNQYAPKTIKAGLETSGRVVYHSDASAPGAMAPELRVRVPGLSSNTRACMIWPKFGDEVTSREDVAGALDKIMGNGLDDVSPTLKAGAKYLASQLDMQDIIQNR